MIKLKIFELYLNIINLKSRPRNSELVARNDFSITLYYLCNHYCIQITLF